MGLGVVVLGTLLCDWSFFLPLDLNGKGDNEIEEGKEVEGGRASEGIYQ